LIASAQVGAGSNHERDVGRAAAPRHAKRAMGDPLMLAAFEKVSGNELKQLQKRCMQLMQQDDEHVFFSAEPRPILPHLLLMPAFLSV